MNAILIMNWAVDIIAAVVVTMEAVDHIIEILMDMIVMMSK